MSRPVPVRDLTKLPWSPEWPNHIGYWWFTHNDGEWAFVAHLDLHDLDEMEREDVFYLHDLHLSKMTRERWSKDGWKCYPVVLA